GLDFSAGDITVHESTVPPGYSFRGDIVLTKANNQIQVASGNDAVFDKGVLIIGNSSDIVNVTVEKTWSNPDDAEDVKIQLLANDRLVSTLIAGINAEVTLNSANSYKYTWNNLPRYANGQKVNWSVREVQIGTEQCKPDFTFSNWIVTYSDVQETGTDGNYEAKLVVNNTRKDAVTLLVFKTNQNNQRLAGATFKLELLYDDGTVNSAFTPQVLTTDSTGLLSFNNLPYGKYRLTETVIPPGYNGMTDPAILLLSDDHTVSIVSGTNVSIVSASNLSVRVTNHSSEPLPNTGGSTPGGIQMAGGVLMLMACLMALNTFVMHRRKQRS
ncbi:MAG: Cna B-type domain-containing protein, partial [Firmicutes bacterium]|nr:Cna B-type domain-containing protein [Bacillota bacterium]